MLIGNLNSTNNYKYRPEIDGLRAFAVLSVVAFHAFPSWLKGGFIGVDVFFVISGFLITSHIFQSLDKGQFSFVDFFGRRIRRIFPALILVMACSMAFGWFALLADEFAQLGKHVAAGAVFIMNFVLVGESGYFDNAAETKPMLHLWSLAVEEQFYIIWPLVLWLAWKRKFNLLTITIVVALVSFYINIRYVEAKPVETFFLPMGRFWELLSGSILAWLLLYNGDQIKQLEGNIDRYLVKIIYAKDTVADGSALANVKAFLGLALLTYGVIRINEDLPFPSCWALIPIFGALLIISAGTQAWLNRVLLMNPMAVWFGAISYPLYLWHWPILSFLQILNGTYPERWLRISAVLLSILLAWLTYMLIEKPVRKRRVSLQLSGSLLFMILLCGAFGFSAYKGVLKPYASYLFPDVTDTAAHMATPEAEKKKCYERLGISSGSKIRYCTISSETESPDVALIGDSHSAAAFLGTSHYLEKDENLTVANLAGRLFANVVNHPKGSEFEIGVYQGGFEVARFLKDRKDIKTIIMVSRGYSYFDENRIFYIPEKPQLKTVKEVFFEGLSDLMKLFPDRQVIFVLENPTLNFDPKNCGAQRPLNLFRSDCKITRQYDNSLHAEYIKEVREFAKSYPNFFVVDPRDVLCDGKFCYASKGGKVIYHDVNHLNRDGSYIQGRQIADAYRKLD